MNYLVYLDAQASELEKILSGVKSMIAREVDPARAPGKPVQAGDSLYFLRSIGDTELQVKATVLRVVPLTAQNQDFPEVLKEMQPKLQLTEAQYTLWSANPGAILVEFGSAQKIALIHLAPEKIPAFSNWIAFEDLTRVIK